jgi:hypothetical protein
MNTDDDGDIQAPTRSARVKTGEERILLKQNHYAGNEKIIIEQYVCVL